MELIIRKIWKNKGTGQLCLTVPKSSGLLEGDYVKVSKIED